MKPEKQKKIIGRVQPPLKPRTEINAGIWWYKKSILNDMNTYKVTVYIASAYGGCFSEEKNIKAVDLESLYEILRVKGYKKYFIGSLLEPAYEN